MHHVCKGSCQAMSEEPKVCGTEGCNMQGQMMEQCDCTDGQHQAAQGSSEENTPQSQMN